MLKVGEIKKLIDDDKVSARKLKAAVGQRYYEGLHDILDYKMYYYNADGKLVEDKARSNSKICHPFFTELVDQLAAYMLSFKENPIRAKDSAEGLQDYLDSYFDEDFWAEVLELITGASAKGFEYIYGFKNAENRLAFQCADSMNVVEVKAKNASDNQDHVLYWYVDTIEKGEKTIKRIQDHTESEITYYIQENDGEIEKDTFEKLNPRPNVVWEEADTGELTYENLGFIPFWRLDNNKRQSSDLKPIKALIDDYDLMECGLSNNLQDFDSPIHLVKGYQGDDLEELQQNIKTKKIVGVDSEGGLDILTVNVPYEARKTKADEDEKNIYRFGFGFNAAMVGDGNITNVVIRSRYTLLDLKANKMENRLKRLLKEIIKVVLNEINTENKTGYQVSDVKFEFTREIMTNETENIANKQIEANIQQTKVNTVLNIAANIGDEQALKAICEIMEFNYDDIKGQIEKMQEKSLEAAMGTLNGVHPEGGEVIGQEPKNAPEGVKQVGDVI